MTGRNDICPCGRGEIYKRCCLGREHWSQADRECAFVRLAAFFDHPQFERHQRLGRELFWPPRSERLDEETHGMIEVRHLLWMLYDAPTGDGRTPAELFLAREGARLAPAERRYIEAMARSHLALYEVAEVLPRHGVVLRDAWGGRDARVYDPVASRTWSVGHLGAARIAERLPGTFEMEGDALTVAPHVRADLLAELEASYAAWRRRWPDGDRQRFLKTAGYLFNGFALRLQLQPASRTGSSACEARYTVSDAEGVQGALTRRALRPGSASHVWVFTTGDHPLGTVRLEGSTLIVEAAGEPALDRLRAQVEEACGSGLHPAGATLP